MRIGFFRMAGGTVSGASCIKYCSIFCQSSFARMGDSGKMLALRAISPLGPGSNKLSRRTPLYMPIICAIAGSTSRQSALGNIAGSTNPWHRLQWATASSLPESPEAGGSFTAVSSFFRLAVQESSRDNIRQSGNNCFMC